MVPKPPSCRASTILPCTTSGSVPETTFWRARAPAMNASATRRSTSPGISSKELIISSRSVFSTYAMASRRSAGLVSVMPMWMVLFAMGVPPEVWSGADRSAVDHAVGVVAFSWCTEVVGSEDPPDHDRDDRGAGELLGEPGDVPVQRGGDDDRLDLVVRGVALDLPPQGRAGDRLRLHLDGDTAGEDVHAIPLAEAHLSLALDAGAPERRGDLLLRVGLVRGGDPHLRERREDRLQLI